MKLVSLEGFVTGLAVTVVGGLIVAAILGAWTTFGSSPKVIASADTPSVQSHDAQIPSILSPPVVHQSVEVRPDPQPALPTSQPAVPPQIALPSQRPTPAEPRVMLDVGLGRLVDMMEDKTDIEAAQMISLYQGKWLKVSGSVANVVAHSYDNSVFVLLRLPPRHGEMYLAQGLTFDREWKERVEALSRGQKIAALCQVTGAEADRVMLGHCERELVAETARKK